MARQGFGCDLPPDPSSTLQRTELTLCKKILDWVGARRYARIFSRARCEWGPARGRAATIDSARMHMRATRFVFGLFSVGFGLSAHPAKAASLQQVNDWGKAGLPADVSMYIYVRDNVAPKPPALALIHYCGGTAQAVFGQAQGGGIVKAADQYGFIMVVPSSGRCWDIVSNKTRTRDGGGDSHAVKQMVTYAIQKYQGNAERVYATGDSSGGMMLGASRQPRQLRRLGSSRPHRQRGYQPR
jgi:hypothetical protein